MGLEVVPGASGKPCNISNRENGNPLKKKELEEEDSLLHLEQREGKSLDLLLLFATF
jgi:hypothetical protein